MRLVSVLPLIALMSGCGANASEGKRLLEAALTDPASVQYRGVFTHTVTDDRRFVCGEFNAKNRMGGYVGYTRFISDLKNGEAFLEARADDAGPNAKLAADTFALQWAVYCAAGAPKR